MTDREAMQMALDALDNVYTTSNDAFHKKACDVLLKALAQPEPNCKTGSQCINGKCHLCATAGCVECDALYIAQPEPEPVANVVIREGLPYLISNREIKATDKRLYTAPPRHEWVGLTDEKSQPEEKYCKQAVDGEIPEAYTPAKGGLLPEQKPEPFGIWHQGDTSEECDFFLYADAGDVTCDTCVKLYTAPSKREWVGLTYLEKEVIIADCTDEEQNHWVNASAVADLIEAKLKEKNR